MPLGPWIRVRPAAGLCAPGGRVPRPGYLGDPRSPSPGFAKMNEGASGAMLCAPLPLFQPEGADEEARGAPGMGAGGTVTGAVSQELPTARAALVCRLQQLRVVGVGACSLGYPSLQPPRAPAAQAASVWPGSHAHPGCALLWCPLN